jgi:hypothetical protein
MRPYDMTYKELLEKIQQLPADRLDDSVTIYDPLTQEYCGVLGAFLADEYDTDVLDPGHLFIVKKA